MTTEHNAFYWLTGWMETHYKYKNNMSKKEWQETLKKIEKDFKITNLIQDGRRNVQPREDR